MTMGLKVRSLFDDKEIKEKAKARKAESDAILESIYELLIDDEGEKKTESEGKKKNKGLIDQKGYSDLKTPPKTYA
jgi:hypothetical protein